MTVILFQKMTSSQIRPAEFLQRHKVFLRRARDAAHQSLFFLGMLEKTDRSATNEAVDEYRPFALYQVRSLVRGVHLPESYTQLQQELEEGGLQVMQMTHSTRADLEHAAAVFGTWCSIFDMLEDHHSTDPEALCREFKAFLQQSRTPVRIAEIRIHGLTDFATYLRKSVSQIWAVLLVTTFLLKVEAVKSLLYNQGLWTFLPIALLAVPLLLLRFLPQVVRRWKGVAPSWDLGGPPFRSCRNQAIEPGRMIARWSSERRSICNAIFFGQVRTFLFLAGWWLLAFGALIFFEDRLGGSCLTAFVVLSHFYALVVLARFLDFWDYLDPRPIRFVLILAGMVLLVALLAGVGRNLVTGSSLVLAIAYSLILIYRRQKGFQWVVVLALLAVAAGSYRGGITLQKEVWRPAAGPSWRLGPGEWPWPAKPGVRTPVVVLAASGGGSRAAVYAGLTLLHLQRDLPYIAEQLQAISSVSGGSLANAAYVARLLNRPVGQDPQVWTKRRNDAMSDLPGALEKDFLRPTIWGALSPGRTRGSSIEREWIEGDIRLGRHHLSDLAERWRQCRKRGSPVPPLPIPLFNSSTLDGHDVVISPFEKTFYSRRGVDDEASNLQLNAYQSEFREGASPTWVYYRDGVYGLEDLLAGFDPQLSSAVRASANFPFGFPLVRLKTTRPLFLSPLARDHEEGTEKEVNLTDGGALSNSGMWSLFNLLMNRDIQPQLRERGVLLIVVEASRMPVYRRVDKAVNSLWGTIEDQGPVGQRLHREMLNLLEATYGDRIAVVQLDLMPREDYNVLTTWALDGGSLGHLHRSFETRWKDERTNLSQSWTQLTRKSWKQLTQDSGAGSSYIARRRPPLD
jgi:hypothetical protein